MKSKDFWGDGGNGAKNEVKNMIPSIALVTLKKFNFRQIKKYDAVAKRDLLKSESVSSWLQNLSSTLEEQSDLKAISENTNLLHYLGLLVSKINDSPDILNEDIKTSEETQSYNPNKFNGQYASKLGIKAKISSLGSVNAGFNRFLQNTAVNNSVNSVFPKILIPIMMKGGDDNSISDYTLHMSDDHKFVSLEFMNQYKALKNILESNGKKIDPNDDKSLLELLDSFQKSEKKVVISIKLIQKYVELLNVFKYNDPQKILTLTNLNELVTTNKNQLEKSVKKQDNLISALHTLASVVEAATKKTNENVVSGTFSNKN
jgi:hypothetical protein